MSNPYTTPTQANPLQSHNNDELKAPAMALIIVSIIALVLGGMALAFDIFLIAVQGVLEAELIVRSLWGLLLFMTSSFVLFGAIKMNNMTNYGVAKAAAIVAIVPLVSPCCLLGIPFGIWALVVLNKPHVRNSFR